jgi:hypothetical protein
MRAVSPIRVLQRLQRVRLQGIHGRHGGDGQVRHRLMPRDERHGGVFIGNDFYLASAETQTKLEGWNLAKFNAATPQGLVFDASSLPGGVYFYRLQAGISHDTNKLVFLK